jgi:integrase/recombinase XerC
MGVSAEDLLATPREKPLLPTFAEYIPVVSAAVSDGTRRVYESYWNRILQHWPDRHLDEPTPSEIKHPAVYRPARRPHPSAPTPSWQTR